MRIAVDAMGGDNAPEAVVKGALEALDSIGDDSLILVGDEQVVREHLGDPARWESQISIVHAPEVVTMDEQPVDALRKKRRSSIAIMARLGAKGDADVVLSAGNTGACVASCQLQMRLLPGVIRPGILVVFPTFAGPVIVCDVGANIAAKPIHLQQYALMSQVYAQEVVGTDNPTVGLISIGQENAKGNELIKATNSIFREDSRINFVGNVESRDFMNKPADIIICDGFVGNVILKLTEGIAEGLFRAILGEIKHLKPDMLEHFKPIIATLYAKHDYNEYGGAPLLGVNGTCIICHGSSDAHAIRNAILKSRLQVQNQVNQKITEMLKPS